MISGYCKLCHLRIQPLATPLLGLPEEQKLDVARASLGSLALKHFASEHKDAYLQLVGSLVQVQALVGLYCLDPAGLVAEPVSSFQLDAQRDQLRQFLAAWLAQDKPVSFDQIATPPEPPGLVRPN
jgi:hypothetical protein